MEGRKERKMERKERKKDQTQEKKERIKRIKKKKGPNRKEERAKQNDIQPGTHTHRDTPTLQ